MFKSLLTDKFFKHKVTFLNFIISQINTCNTTLQAQALPIHEFKISMTRCYNQIASLILKPEKFDQGIKTLFTLDWDQDSVQKECLRGALDFVSNLPSQSGHKPFTELSALPSSQQEQFYEAFKPFIVSILKYLTQYLPLTDPVIESLDFVRLMDNLATTIAKVETFNEYFKISSPEKVQEELLSLYSDGFRQYREQCNSLLEMWNEIERAGYTHLAAVAKAAQLLPTSSADVEQCFSDAKLIKTLLRNRLSETSFEALLLISEEVRTNGKLSVTKDMVERLDLVLQQVSKKRKADRPLEGELEGNQSNPPNPSNQGHQGDQVEDQNAMIIENQGEQGSKQ